MIVEDIIIRVRRIFGDEAAVQVSNDDIIRWINDGQIEIVRNNDGALQRSSQINLTAGQFEYGVPDDLLILRSLRYKSSDMSSFMHLRYRNMQQFDEILDGWDGTAHPASAPEYFTIYEGMIILFPTPNADSAGGLKVLYNRKPTDVVNPTDEIDLPLLYHPVILKYCLWQASLLDEDHEPAMMYQNNFKGDMDLMSMRETSDPVEKYHTITVLEGDL